MWGYILGMTLGSISTLIGLSFGIFYLINKRNYKKKIKQIGLKAEIKINSDLKFWSKQTKNLFLNNLLYQQDVNKLLKIDSILITSKALIIISIKSVKGVITGDAKQIRWVKTVDSTQFQIINPIIKNEKNIDQLVKISGIRIPTISLIIFSNKTNYLKITNIPKHVVITKHSDLFDTLDQIDTSLQVALSTYEMRTIFTTLKSLKVKRSRNFKKPKKEVTWK